MEWLAREANKSVPRGVRELAKLAAAFFGRGWVRQLDGARVQRHIVDFSFRLMETTTTRCRTLKLRIQRKGLCRVFSSRVGEGCSRFHSLLLVTRQHSTSF